MHAHTHRGAGGGGSAGAGSPRERGAAWLTVSLIGASRPSSFEGAVRHAAAPAHMARSRAAASTTTKRATLPLEHSSRLPTTTEQGTAVGSRSPTPHGRVVML